MGAVKCDDQIKAGKAKLKGARKPYDELKNMLSTFTIVFELLPGTLPEKEADSAKENPSTSIPNEVTFSAINFIFCPIPF